MNEPSLSPDSAILNVQIVEKRFVNQSIDDPVEQGVLALKNLQFSVKKGQFTCLIGPSGCGKSTLINLINGLDTDFKGELNLAGQSTLQGVSTLFQTPRLMPWLTVLDNVCLVLPSSNRSKQQAIDLLSAMELGEVLKAYPRQLSGGMQRRVALARAFAINPTLLLLDEPFVSLDAPVANRLRSMLLELWQQQANTVLFVTHDLREALALADRVIFLSAGPAHLLLDLVVDLPRPRKFEGEVVEQLRKQLLTQYPDLLAGSLNESKHEGQTLKESDC